MAAPKRPLPAFVADAKAGPWLYFRLLARANPARASAPAWSAPELVAAAAAEGLSPSASAVRSSISDRFKTRGLIERANSDGLDVAWRLSDAGRALAEQHGVTLAPPMQLDEPLPARERRGFAGFGDTLPPNDGRVRKAAPGPAASRGRWLYFRLLAAPNPAANGRAEWRSFELLREASAATGRSFSDGAVSLGMADLARLGFAARTFRNPTAPWVYTAAGTAKARELGILPAEDAAAEGDAEEEEPAEA